MSPPLNMARFESAEWPILLISSGEHFRKESVMAIFEGPDRNRNMIIAAAVLVAIAVIIYFYYGG